MKFDKLNPFWINTESKELAAFRRKVYNNPAYKAAREVALTIHPFCTECLKEGKVTPAVETDHIINLSSIYLSKSYSLAFDYTNLNPLCKRHHSQKSWKEGIGKYLKFKRK